MSDDLDKLDAALASQIGDDVAVIFNHESLFKRSREAIAALRSRAEADAAEIAALKAQLKAERAKVAALVEAARPFSQCVIRNGAQVICDVTVEQVFNLRAAITAAKGE